MLLLFALPVVLLMTAVALRAVLRDLAACSAAGPALARCGLPARDPGLCPAALWWRTLRPHGLHLPHAP